VVHDAAVAVADADAVVVAVAAVAVVVVVEDKLVDTVDGDDDANGL
jgi:hypothetical protein